MADVEEVNTETHNVGLRPTPPVAGSLRGPTFQCD